MRRLVYIFVVLLVAGAVSCHRTSETEARLIAIDSLISSTGAAANYGTGASPADSALALLEEFDTSSLHGEDCAYHALLTAQAMYKAYIPATSDSIINIAWDYYKDCGIFSGPVARRRRIRAMLYKGTTAEETGHLDSAMYWYKRTELESRPDDHYHRGYALLRLAALYQSQHTTDSADLERYKQALSHFTVLSDTNYMLVCLTEIGTLYRTKDIDSADHYISRALALSERYPDKFFYYTNLVVDAGMNILRGSYRQTADTCLKILSSGYNDYNTPDLCCTYLAYAYIKLGKSDSAQMYMPLEMKNNTPGNMVSYYIAKSEIAKSRGDSIGFYRYDNLQLHIADSVMFDSLKTEIHKINVSFDKRRSQEKMMRMFFIITILSLLICILILALSLSLTRKKNAIDKFKASLIELKNELRSTQNSTNSLQEELKIEKSINAEKSEQISVLSSQVTSLKNDNLANKNTTDEFSAIIARHIDILQNIGELLELFSARPDILAKKAKAIFHSIKPDKDFWQRIENYTDINYNGSATKIFSAYPNLREEDRHLILLMIIGMSNKAIMSFTYLNSENAIKTRAYRIKEKMGLDIPLRKYIERTLQSNGSFAGN